MKNVRFLVFAFLLLPFALSSCGGGSSSGGGISGTTQLTGTVYAPNGSDPIAGATVYVPSGSASISVKAPSGKSAIGKTATTCDAAPETSCAEGCSGSDGTFTLNVSSCASSDTSLKAKKGSLTLTMTIACTTADCAIPAADTKFPSSGADIPQMAVVTGSYDDIQDVLAKLGYGTPDGNGQLTLGTEQFTLFDGNDSLDSPYHDFSEVLDGTIAIGTYDIVFINCGADGGDTLTTAQKTVLRDFVTAGGKLYVTDLSYDFIEQVFPEFLMFEDDPSDPLTPGSVGAADLGTAGLIVSATVNNAVMAEWLAEVTVIANGSGGPGNPEDDCSAGTYTTRTSALDSSGYIPIDDFLGGWAEIEGKHTGSGALDPTLWILDAAAGTTGLANRPLTASVAFGTNGGKIAYSSYHTAHSCPTIHFWPQERVLEYLIFETF